VIVALGIILGISALVTCYRMMRGPSTADRVIAFDLVAAIGVAMLAVTAAERGALLYLDVAIGLALIAFVGTVAIATYLERRSRD
jgi:multicomponent Na+:H+ antiporter subunit F